MSIIQCENLSISFNKTSVLKDLSFTVEEGDYLCIVGENGSGKSTLIKCLLGLEVPDKGHIITEKSLFDHIGYLPQQTSIQRDFPATVFEVVLSGFLNDLGFSIFYSKKHKQTADKMLKLFGIYEIKNKSYRTLSGGQQQRVLLARAMCSTKRLLLLDEPLSGLDPLVVSDFYTIMHKLNHIHKITIIMVSHSISEAVREANKILHLCDDCSYFFGSTEDYIKSPFGERFLGRTDK
ncbi:MAG: metal ABC transporter ATP-binding protein [Ruminococcaceae bacterium]|nr:metal ABC transporter ATP-binding protein [Oscillospiraceae bacterium]